MVFWQERLAILATPKTASTAMAAALGGLAAVVIQRPKTLKHTDAERFAAFWQPYLTAAAGDRFEVAALMRHPRDWLGSWYRDGQRDDVEPGMSTRGMSFDDFVQAYCAPGKRPSFADVGSQADFLGRNGPARVGCEILLPRLNVSPLANTSLTTTTEALLHQVCAEDFALYDGLGRG